MSFVRQQFTIPSAALPAITGNHADVTVTIVINANAGTSGWLLNDLRFGS